MATYADITAVESDAESPITSALMSKYVNNPIALYENTRPYAIKAADSPALNNDATLNDDPDLVVTLDKAGVIWWFHALVYILTTRSAGYRWKFVTPAETATGHMLTVEYKQAALSAPPPVFAYSLGTSAIHTNTEVIVTGAGGYTTYVLMLEAYGWTYPSATGSLQFQWAQGSSHADSTYTKQGSHLTARCLNYIT